MKGVVFDLDGTLIDSLPQIAKAANSVLIARGCPPLEAARVAGFVGLGEQVFVDRLIAATSLDAAARADILAQFMQSYAEASRDTTLFDGVDAALAALVARGVPLGLCTNKPGAALTPVLRVTGLSAYLGSVVAGDRLAVRKPDPAPLHLAFEELGVAPGLYVGDSETDAETAQRAGVPFALFTRGIRQRPVFEIPHDVAYDDTADLPAIVARYV